MQRLNAELAVGEVSICGQLSDCTELHVLLQPLADVVGVLLHRRRVVVDDCGRGAHERQADALRDVRFDVCQAGQVGAGLGPHTRDGGEPVSLLLGAVYAWGGVEAGRL